MPEWLPFGDIESYWGAEDWDLAEQGEAVGESGRCQDCHEITLVKRCIFCWIPTCYKCSLKSNHGIC